MTERKKYSKEFKLDAVSLVIDQGYTRVEAARSLGINHSNKNAATRMGSGLEMQPFFG